MTCVLVFGDASGGTLSESSLEIMTIARILGEALGKSAVSALIGSDIEMVAQAFLSGGADRLYVIDDQRYETYSSDLWLAAAESIVSDCSPSLILFPHDLNTREWVPRLAARLGAGLTTDCTDLTVIDGGIILTKPIYGGSVMAEYIVTTSIVMATIRPGSYEPKSVGTSGTMVKLDPVDVDSCIAVLEEIVDVAVEGPRLKDAKVVVSGGLGVGGPDNWHLIEETAAALDAAVGATRAVTDLGWVSSSYQVGLTGTSIAPDLYVAIGVSGAIQHMAGITRAKITVAVNKDREAAIFGVARLGAIGDAAEIVPAFAKRVRELRSISG